MAAYGVTPGGNASAGSAHGFVGKNILEFVGNLDQRPSLAEARRKLFETREQRVHPGRDEKVLTSWNGLMLAVFAEAARTLNRVDYQEVAERNAEFLLHELRQENDRLLRSWKDGETQLNSYLEDYSYLIETLVTHPRDLQDNATPSGNAMAVTTLLKTVNHHLVTERGDHTPQLTPSTVPFARWA